MKFFIATFMSAPSHKGFFASLASYVFVGSVVCSQLGLPTLEHRRLTSTLLQVHRCTVILLRTYHTNLYLKILFANYPTTRGATNLHLKNPRTNAYKSTFEYFGATQSNKLTDHIKSMKTDAAFQKAICSLFI